MSPTPQTPPTDRPLTAGDVLWMVHVIGPDDIYPAPDHATAVEWCAYVNGEVAPLMPSVLCAAVPAIWTGSTEDHAAELPKAVEGWSRPATSAASDGEGLHLGDPCIRCGIEHDDVPVGPCGGLDAAVCKVKEMAKWEREGHASIKIAPLNIILSAVCARTLSPEVQGLPSQNDYSPRKPLTNSALASPPVSERERELEGALRVFADVLADVGEDEADDDLYATMSAPHRRAEPIRIGHLRRAAALTAQPAGEPTHG